MATTRAALASLVVTLLAVGLVSGPAKAVQVAQDGLVSADPAGSTPHVLDGEVFAVAEVGDVVVLGGRFTQARDPSEGSPVVPRSNLLAFDRTTGALLPGFAPVVDDVVRSLAPAGDGTSVYVGGQFGAIDGRAAYKVARLDVRTAQPVAAFKPKRLDAAVMDVKASGGRLFVAGKFTSVGGVARPHLAELDATTGALRTGIASTFTGAVWAGTAYVHKIDVSPDGRRMVAIGNFRTVDAQSRIQIAQLDLTASPATLVDWSTERFSIRCGSSGSTQFDVRDVDFSPDGSYFVVGATGGHTAQGALCDGVSRWEAAPRGPRQEPTWFDLTGGDSVYAVAATGAAVYAGGHFRWFNNPVYVQSYKGPGAVDREGIAALDPVNGVPLSWNPGRDRGMAVWDLVATSHGLYVGSDTDRIGRYEYHARIALFPLAGGSAVPQPRAPDLPVDVQLASPPGSTDALVRRGDFDGDASLPAQSLPGAGGGWSSVRGAFVADGSLYSAGSDGVLRRRPVEGTGFGSPTTLPLNGLTALASEMSAMTSLFYDEGRIYYTLSGQNALYSRYFSVESGIVGATRTTAVAAAGGFDWRSVRGAFLSGGHLYWAHSSNGSLSRVLWQSRLPVTSTSTVVSSPALDGADWRSNALFAVPAAARPTVSVTADCTGTSCQLLGEVSGIEPERITSWQWVFDDGSTAQGREVDRTFAPGAQVVELTVVTDQAVTATGTRTLDLANAAPSAVASASCAGLMCSFDGSGSEDADGEIVAWSWDFGDGTTSTVGPVVEHGYASGGPRSATLTVTDDRGQTSSVGVDTDPAASAVQAVATAANTAQVTSTTRSVTVPDAVREGDVLLLFWSGNGPDANATAPAGWSAGGGVTTASSAHRVWSRTATAADAGSAVPVSTPTALKADLVLAVYRNARLDQGAVTMAAETQTTAAHASPLVEVTTPGSWLVSYWADKSASTTAWTPPDGTVRRHTSAGSGAGHVSELLVDSGAPIPTGPAGGLVAVADSAQRNAAAATVVLSPSD